MTRIFCAAIRFVESACIRYQLKRVTTRENFIFVKNWKDVIRRTPLYREYRRWRRKKKQIKAIAEWKAKGRPVPPPHIIKEMTLRIFGRRYRLGVLVETGTKFGDMLLGVGDNFERIYSIELSADFVARARRRFAHCRHIELIEGDSGEEIEFLLPRIDRPALFFLDSHFSGAETAKGETETPILLELEHILTSPDPGHVILIDDARYFGVNPDYPTLPQLAEFVRARRDDVEIRVRDDIIRITPRSK